MTHANAARRPARNGAGRLGTVADVRPARRGRGRRPARRGRGRAAAKRTCRECPAWAGGGAAGARVRGPETF